MNLEDIKKVFADLFYHRDNQKKDKLVTFTLEEKDDKVKLIPLKGSISDQLLNKGNGK